MSMGATRDALESWGADECKLSGLTALVALIGLAEVQSILSLFEPSAKRSLVAAYWLAMCRGYRVGSTTHKGLGAFQVAPCQLRDP